MSGPTPGPWTIADEPLDEHRRTVFALTEADFAPAIAGGDTEEQRDANARLIAAAPDLLAACEDMIYRFGAYEPGAPEGEGSNAAAILRARAALSKARGEGARP